MDEAFMSRVAERIAAATEAVSSFSPTADPGKFPAVQTMDEWMASHSPGAKQRCGDCKAPLVEGSATICIACGRQLPPRLALKREPFCFDQSLTKKLFYESVHLEDPHDTSTDTTEMPNRPTGSGTIIANGSYSEQQQSASGIGLGVEEVVESNVQGDERGEGTVFDASVPVAVLSSKPLKVEEEDEDYIWGSADADDFGSRAWSQQLAQNSGGDPKDFLSASDSAAAFNSANNTLGQASSTNDDDFFAAASLAADLSPILSSAETDLNIFFPSASTSGGQIRGEQATTAGSNRSKESFSPSVGTDFHDFFQTSAPSDPKLQTSDPNGRVASADQTVEKYFDDFFQAVPASSTDESHRHNNEATISGEQSNAHNNLETDFDDFFQGAPKSADHSHGVNAETPAPPHDAAAAAAAAAEESGSHSISTDFDGFFQAVPEPVGHSGGPHLETPFPHTAAEESNRQDGRFEADFDDFLQAAPSSADQFGGASNEQPSPVRHLAGEFSGQREEPQFDFFFQTSRVSASQSRGSGVEAVAPRSPENASGQDVKSDFDFFFQTPPPVSPDVETAFHLAKESSGQIVDDDHFDNFFQNPRKAAALDQDRGQNVETAVPLSAVENGGQTLRADFDDLFGFGLQSANRPGGLNGETSVPHTAAAAADGAGGGHDGEVDFDDFFQAAPAPAKSDDSRGQTIETDFDDFFRATPTPAKGSGGHTNGGADFDFFFQTPEPKDRSHTQHAKADNSDGVEKSNGRIVEPDFDEFFLAANNSTDRSHGRKKVNAVAPRLATESGGHVGETAFADLFQAARNSGGKPNNGHGHGHTPAAHPDFFQTAPHVNHENGFPGQTMSVGFDGFFSTASSASSVTKGLDPFLQADPLSVDKSLDQNGTADVDNGDFDDFVQAAPQSADKVGGSSQSTEFDSFFQARPRSVEASPQSSATDFDDFFQAAAPKTAADKPPPNVNTGTQFEFVTTSHQSADKSHSRKASTDFGNRFEVPLPWNAAPMPPSSYSEPFVYGNGSGQIHQVHQVAARPIRTLNPGGLVGTMIANGRSFQDLI